MQHRGCHAHRSHKSFRVRLQRLLQWVMIFSMIILSTLLPVSSARADYVGTGSVQLTLDPASVPVIADGYQAGDVVSYILQQAPRVVSTGNITGVVAYGTIYVPAGVEVVNAELVQFSGGVYTAIPAEDIATMTNGCGARGCRTYGANLGNGKVNEVQQDTGIFYSIDAQTALTGSQSIATTGTGTQLVWNQWDYNQIVAFGRSSALSGNSGTGNTPVVTTVDGGAAYEGTGSAVAGPLTYYKNDYDPSCSASTVFKDDARCVGPWQRIAYPNAKIGGNGAIAPTNVSPGAFLNTSVPTSAGYSFSTSGALPANTKAVRYVFGKRLAGDLELARVTFRITNPAQFTASFLNNSFCADGTGGDYDRPNRGGQDNIWRYYEGNNHTCYQGSSAAMLTKTPKFVNGVAAQNEAPANSVIGYEMTFVNTTNSTLTNIALTDAPLTSNLTLVAPGTANCPYTSYNGNQSGLPTFSGISSGAASWSVLPSLASGQSVTVRLCARVASTAVAGAEIRNRVTANYSMNGQAQPALTADSLQLVGAPPPNPSLTIVKSGSTGPVPVGASVNYTITVQNTGNVTITNVTVSDAKLGLNQNLGTLLSGAIVTLSRSYGPVPEGDVPLLTNTASVTGVTPASAVFGPVSATHTIPVYAVADLGITKSSQPSPVGSGELLTYTVRVQNLGPAAAQTITVTEGLPLTGVIYQSHSASAGSYDSGANRWTLPSLAANSIATLTLVTRITAAETVTNVATVAAITPDPVPDNNIYTNTTPVLATVLQGVVTDAGTGVPLVGAQVIITDSANHVYTVTTTAGGWYTITASPTTPLAPGPVNVTASYPAYAPGTIPGTIVAGQVNQVDVPLRTVNLIITKDDGLTTALPGQVLTYTISITNAGSLTATNVVITDILPSELIYLGNSAGLAPTTPPGTYVGSLPDIAPGTGLTFTLTARVTDTLPYGITTVENYVRVRTTDPERDITNNERTDRTDVLSQPDLTLRKIAVATTPVLNSVTITYVLSGANIGSATATGVTISDTLDSQVSYNTGSATATVNGLGATVVVTEGAPLRFGLPDLAPGASYVLTFTVQVAGSISAVSVDNAAVIGSIETDRNIADNSDSVSLPTSAGVDLYIRKQATPAVLPTTPGALILYTLEYGNLGTTTAATAIIADVLPENTVFVSGTPGYTPDPPTSATPEFMWTFSNIAPGASGVVTFTLQIADPLPAGVLAIENSAEITTTGDVNPNNNQSAVTTPITAAPNLVIVKTNNRTQVVAGELVTYTLTYSNTGNRGASGVVITDTVLANLDIEAYVSAEPPFDIDRSDIANGILVWDFQGQEMGPLEAGSFGVITVEATVSSTASAGLLVANRVTIVDDGANGPDPDPSDNTSTDTDLIVRPFVVIEKRANGAAHIGGVVTYTVAYQNMGLATATAVVISDVIPANTSYIAGSATGGGAFSGGVVTWDIGELTPGASGERSFAVILESGAGGATTTAPSLSIEPAAGTRIITSSVTLVPQPGCDFDGRCASLKGVWQGPDSTGPLDWNSNPRLLNFDDTGWLEPIPATPEFYWTNPANLSAEWVAIYTNTAHFDPNYTFYRQAFCTPLNATGLTASLQQANDDVGDIYLNGVYIGRKLGSGAAATFPADGGIQSGINLLAVRVLNNNHGGHSAFDGGDHSGLIFNLSASYSNVRPFVSAPSMVLAGQNVSFVADPQALGGRQPYSYTIDYGDNSSAPYQLGTSFTHSYAAPGVYVATVTARAQYGCTGADQIVVTVLPVDSTLLANRATVGYANTLGTPYGGEAGAGVLVPPHLSVSKSDAPDPVVAGELLQYTVLVTNTGAVAHNVTVTDVLPAEATLLSATPVYTAEGSIVTWQLGNLAVDATRSLTLTVRVAPAFAGVVTNTVAVRADEPDPQPGGSEDSEPTQVERVADLGITKISAPNPHLAGRSIGYTLVVTNAGPSTLSAITVTDHLPGAITAVNYVPAAGAFDATTGAWTGLNLAAGDRITLTITGLVDPAATGTLSNTALVATPQATDPAPDNNSSTDENPQAALVLTKHGALDMTVVTPPDQANVGDVIRYTLAATNTGAAVLTSVTISDALLGGLGCTPSQPAELSPGAALACTGVYTLTQTDIDRGWVDNNATAGSDQTPSIDVPVQVAVPSAPDFSFSKHGVLNPAVVPPPDRPDAGDVISYTLVVTNTGNKMLSDVLIEDPRLPMLACSPQITLPVGANVICTGIYTLTQIDIDTGIVTNTATADTDQAPAQDASESVPLAASPALTLVKAASPLTYTAVGQVITYSYVVTNTGNVSLYPPATIIDDKIGEVTCPALTPTGVVGEPLAPGEAVTCQATYTVTQADLDTGAVTNVASATIEQTTSPTATATVTAIQSPALALVKSALPMTYTTVGEVITYTYIVTNTGNVSLSKPVTITDDKIGVFACLAFAPQRIGNDLFAPGEVVTCEAVYTTTAADLTNGAVTNVATASAGAVTSPPASATVTAVRGAVEGVIYIDVNGDGVFTPGTDTPQPNISVVITDSVGVVYTAVTDANGYFSQTVPAGTTVIDVVDATLPAGLVLTINNTDPSTVTVPVGGVARDDTGYVWLPGRVEGVIFLDVDGDGVYTPGADTPLPNVSIIITDSTGAPHVIITDGNGFYSQGVPPGVTVIDVDEATLPQNTLLTINNTDPTSVTVPPNDVAVDNTGYVILTLDSAKMVSESTPPQVHTGDDIEFLIVITNTTAISVSNLLVVEHIPTGLILSPNDANGWVPAPDGRTATYLIAGPIPVGGAVPLHVLMRVETRENITLVNVITVPGAGGGEEPPITESETEIGVNPTPTAIELDGFAAHYADGVVWVRWTTVLERDLMGFQVLRSQGEDSEGRELITAELIPSRGVGSDYEVVDGNVAPESGYWYWLVRVDLQGSAEVVAVTRVTTSLAPLPDALGNLFLPLINR